MNKKHLIIMGLSLGLPSTIIGLFFVLQILVENGVINYLTMLISLVALVSFTFYLIINYATSRKTK